MAYGHAQSDSDDRLTVNPGLLAVEPLQQFLQQKGCCRGLYNRCTLSHGPISSTALYSLQLYSSSTVYNLYTIPLVSNSDHRVNLRRSGDTALPSLRSKAKHAVLAVEEHVAPPP